MGKENKELGNMLVVRSIPTPAREGCYCDFSMAECQKVSNEICQKVSSEAVPKKVLTVEESLQEFFIYSRISVWQP